ncbi:(2Fe-2S)-binding protein [Teichococcus aestuarii]|uniref:Oxidoreductase n=1 Tax=Teichococcus aestuarii TaxID=568898 RepID=A0A2U1VAF7_9PROT|nr:(2Fe-2S)-binding protein [Pseudoroseomonas aestuarii]PWC30805.1 oxidoreductase [Pseudoroseomonas aestuarii]
MSEAHHPAAAPPRAVPPAPDGDWPIATLTLRVNGQAHRLAMDTRTTLLDALRDHLGLTGAKPGCNQGACGACTVLIDGKRMNACLTLAVATQGQEITTIEGLAEGEALHPMQQAFIDHDAFQCGYCTPGQIISAVACIREGHAGSAEEIREFMSGNLCRCGAYPNIVKAVQDVAAKGGA